MLCICFCVGIFIVRNTHKVWVDYLWGQGQLPMWAVAILAMVVGMLIAMLMQVFDQVAHQKKQRRLESECKRLREKLGEDAE